jgi:hypothetical protein
MSDTSHHANAGTPSQPSQPHAAAAQPLGAGRPSAAELDAREQQKARPRRPAGPPLTSGAGGPAAAAPAPAPAPSTATDP